MNSGSAIATLLLTLCVVAQAKDSISPPFAVPSELKLTGKIFDNAASATTPAFVYVTVRRQEGPQLISTTTYRDPVGNLLVEENTTYENGRLTRYVYDQKQVQESGEIELKDGKASYKFRAAGKKEASDSESIEPNMIVPDMVPAVVQTHWQDLMNGETVKTRFLVLERQDTFGFKFYKAKEREQGGIAVVDFILKPTSFIIAAITPRIRITLEKAAPHHAVELEGILPVRIPEKFPPVKRSDYHALDGVLKFDPIK
ncbi:MAG: hypothetical protein ACXWQO_02015 [Bdellovibrionota bacterium]